MEDKLRNMLNELSPMDKLTLTSCIHYCSVLPKKQREDFVKQYGNQVDSQITDIMGRWLKK